MADVLHRTTKEHLRSVNTPDYPVQDWIINPDLTLVAGIDRKYWKITLDVVSEMTQPEKDAVDAAELAAINASIHAALTSEPDETKEEKATRIRALIELFNKRDNYLTNRIAELQEDLQAIKATSGPADNIRGAIRSSYLATSTRPKSQAISDYKADIAAGNQDA